MRRRTFSACALAGAFALRAIGQGVSVAALTREETARAAELYKRLKSAEIEWAEYRWAIRDKYGPLVAKDLPPSRRREFTKRDGTQFQIPNDWAQGIEFSDDFRFVTGTR